MPARPFAGTTLAGSGIYEKTGCRVIAIEDEDGVTSTLDPGRESDVSSASSSGSTSPRPPQAVRRLLGLLKRFDVSSAEEIA